MHLTVVSGNLEWSGQSKRVSDTKPETPAWLGPAERAVQDTWRLTLVNAASAIGRTVDR